MTSRTAVIVPAAGSGARLGGARPKALEQLGGLTLLERAVRQMAAAESVEFVVVAAPSSAVTEVSRILATAKSTPGTVVAGGASRQESVSAALAVLPPQIDFVLVHDAARPLAPAALAGRVIRALAAGADAVIPGLPVTDTIKQVTGDGMVVATPDRTALRAIQTPQGFRREVLEDAHARIGTDVWSTDDAALVERAGYQVHVIDGDDLAFKITKPPDLLLARALLRIASEGEDRQT